MRDINKLLFDKISKLWQFYLLPLLVGEIQFCSILVQIRYCTSYNTWRGRLVGWRVFTEEWRTSRSERQRARNPRRKREKAARRETLTNSTRTKAIQISSMRRWPAIKHGDAFYRGLAGFVCTQKLLEGRPLARRRKRRYEEDARDVTGSDNAPPRIACTHTHNAERLTTHPRWRTRSNVVHVRCTSRSRASLSLRCCATRRSAPHRTAPHRIATTREQRASGLFNTLRYKLFPIRSHTVTKRLRNWLVKIFETSSGRIASVVRSKYNKYLEISSALWRKRCLSRYYIGETTMKTHIDRLRRLKQLSIVVYDFFKQIYACGGTNVFKTWHVRRGKCTRVRNTLVKISCGERSNISVDFPRACIYRVSRSIPWQVERECVNTCPVWPRFRIVASSILSKPRIRVSFAISVNADLSKRVFTAYDRRCFGRFLRIKLTDRLQICQRETLNSVLIYSRRRRYDAKDERNQRRLMYRRYKYLSE